MFVGGGNGERKGSRHQDMGGKWRGKLSSYLHVILNQARQGPALPQAVPNTPFLTRGSGTEGIQFEDR